MEIDITHCVSEQGQTQTLWTVFEGQPFQSRRIASFATEEDARYWIGAIEVFQVFNELKAQGKIQHVEDLSEAIEEKDELSKTVQELRQLQIALAESVKLQAHYASLLNMWDGGQRMIFPDSSAWIARLKETGTLK